MTNLLTDLDGLRAGQLTTIGAARLHPIQESLQREDLVAPVNHGHTGRHHVTVLFAAPRGPDRGDGAR